MPETLFLTANLIDRFLEKKRVSRRNLQLVRPLSEPLGAPKFYILRSYIILSQPVCLVGACDAAVEKDDNHGPCTASCEALESLLTLLGEASVEVS